MVAVYGKGDMEFAADLKVVYISYMHLSDKVSCDWYIDFLFENGVDVEYWDVTEIIFGMSVGKSKDASYVRVPEDLFQIEDWLRKRQNGHVQYVVILSYDGRSAELYRLLSKYSCRTLHISWGWLPIRRHSSGWGRQLYGWLWKPGDLLSRVFGKAKAYAYLKLGFIGRYDVVFAAGECAYNAAQFARKVVPVNLVDYDHHADMVKQNEKVLKKKSAVFLDVNFPYHSDLKAVGLPCLQPSKYYASLRRFFTRVEHETGVEVVIAAHPKSSYDFEIFGGRRVYRGMTASLVRDSDFVISHHSTAISYAVLDEKPIVFIYTDEMEEIYSNTFVSYIRDFSEFLDAPFWNIDAMPEGLTLTIGSIDSERYARYKYGYLTTKDSECVKTREIFWGELTQWRCQVGRSDKG